VYWGIIIFHFSETLKWKGHKLAWLLGNNFLARFIGVIVKDDIKQGNCQIFTKEADISSITPLSEGIGFFRNYPFIHLITGQTSILGFYIRCFCWFIYSRTSRCITVEPVLNCCVIEIEHLKSTIFFASNTSLKRPQNTVTRRRKEWNILKSLWGSQLILHH